MNQRSIKYASDREVWIVLAVIFVLGVTGMLLIGWLA